MPAKFYEFTIIVPVFNEEDNLQRVENKLCEFLDHSLCSSMVLFVNDGSKDNSQRMIEDICLRNKNFFFLELEKNHGLSTALKAGIDHCNTKFLGYIDSDLQTSPVDFNKLLVHRDKYEMVTGIRAKRKDKFVKKISSRIANGIRRMVTHDGVSDTGCPLKVFKTSSAKAIPFFKGMHRFLPALIRLQEGRVKQVPVNHFPRMAGNAKYHLFNRLITPLRDLIAFHWMRRRYIYYQIKKQG